ncbi:hunchback transcription factor [Echinococcus multilocularis]|uniref:Hunchback transcription factor n=1 Tax=Echinococcus multilocularis TaxID=6211 RepID=A0A068Y4M9_ECHMU|nr:hunchback transcription factor [Echinococcus multilocularis]
MVAVVRQRRDASGCGCETITAFSPGCHGSSMTLTGESHAVPPMRSVAPFSTDQKGSTLKTRHKRLLSKDKLSDQFSKMFAPDSFGLVRPDLHSSPMALPHRSQAPAIRFPPLIFPTLAHTIPTTTKSDETENAHLPNQNFFQIIQTMLGSCGIKSCEEMVDESVPVACPSGPEVAMEAVAGRQPSLELVVDAQNVMESSSSTPPSIIDTKRTSPTSPSSHSWPSVSSQISKSSAQNPTHALDESEERLNSGQMEIFTDSIQPDTDGIYFCHLCEYTGNKRQEFQIHLRSHYDYQCPKCDYTSRTEGRLRRHMEGFHSAVPPENFSGKSSRPPNKLKLQRCKQCDYVAETKTDYWQHQRTHIKADRQLQCTQCPFVTEYRHHLEYHIRNHLGSKPYKCSKCNYECVNKSMLNSHMKSHTNVYQYRCADCNYATKYCHSLKIHLTKHKHTQAVVLNVDGSLPERTNALLIKPDQVAPLMSQPSPLPATPMLPLFPPPPINLQPEIPSNRSQENLALMTAFVLSMQQQAFPQTPPPPSTSFPSLLNLPFKPETPALYMTEDDVLDLSAPKTEARTQEENIPTSLAKYECGYCEIIFKNEALFELHKQFHDPKDPFRCKRCGIRCKDSVDFFNHINEKEHGGSSA